MKTRSSSPYLRRIIFRRQLIVSKHVERFFISPKKKLNGLTRWTCVLTSVQILHAQMPRPVDSSRGEWARQFPLSRRPTHFCVASVFQVRTSRPDTTTTTTTTTTARRRRHRRRHCCSSSARSRHRSPTAATTKLLPPPPSPPPSPPSLIHHRGASPARQACHPCRSDGRRGRCSPRRVDPRIRRTMPLSGGFDPGRAGATVSPEPQANTLLRRKRISGPNVTPR